MPLSAADKMTIENPTIPHTAAPINAMLLSGKRPRIGDTSWTHVRGSWWKTLRMALRVPVCGCPGGWYAYMNFQITTVATDEIAIGMKIRDLTIFS